MSIFYVLHIPYLNSRLWSLSWYGLDQSLNLISFDNRLLSQRPSSLCCHKHRSLRAARRSSHLSTLFPQTLSSHIFQQKITLCAFNIYFSSLTCSSQHAPKYLCFVSMEVQQPVVSPGQGWGYIYSLGDEEEVTSVFTTPRGDNATLTT